MRLHPFLLDLFESGRVRLTAEALQPELASDEVEPTLADRVEYFADGRKIVSDEKCAGGDGTCASIKFLSMADKMS